MLTYREAKYVNQRLLGHSKAQSARAAGFSNWLATSISHLETQEMRETVERLQKELVDHALQVGLIDAAELHEYLTEALRADMRDIRNDDGSFKPQSEWPEIWGRMMEAGDVEVEYASERSHDGKTKDRRGGWDQTGKVEKVKLKFTSRAKLLELAMKHKAVNAMVEQKSGDVHLHVHGEIRNKLQGALAREQQLIEAEAIDVKSAE